MQHCDIYDNIQRQWFTFVMFHRDTIYFIFIQLDYNTYLFNYNDTRFKHL